MKVIIPILFLLLNLIAGIALIAFTTCLFVSWYNGYPVWYSPLIAFGISIFLACVVWIPGRKIVNKK